MAMIELLKRYHPDKKQAWLLYVSQENKDLLKELKEKLIKLPKTAYFNGAGRLVGWHWYGPYETFTRVLKGYKYALKV